MVEGRLDPGRDAQWVFGVVGPAWASAIGLFGGQAAQVRVVLCESLRICESLEADLVSLGVLSGSVIVLPELGEFDADDPRRFERYCDRSAVVEQLLDRVEGSALTILTTLRALLEPVPQRGFLESSAESVHVGAQTDPAKLAKTLAESLGYSSEAVCETPGQFAVRGGLLDVYPINAGAPLRLDFFGDEVESIREFDPTTQRSERSVESVRLFPVSDTSWLERTPWGGVRDSGVIGYLPEAVEWLFIEPGVQARQMPEIFSWPEALQAPPINVRHLLDGRNGNPDRWIGIGLLEAPAGLFEGTGNVLELDTESLERHRPFADADQLGFARLETEEAAREQFLRVLRGWHEAGHRVTFCGKTQAGVARMRKVVSESDSLGPCIRGIEFQVWDLSEGFRAQWPGHAEAVVTESELFGIRKIRVPTRRRRLPERKAVDDALDFSELVDGDHLVHLSHGVCIFRGLQTLDVDGRREEVISLEFADEVTLHVKLHDSHLLSRYIGLTKAAPRLGRLGSSSWSKTRAAAERATLDFAAELLCIQAERDANPGHAFGADHEIQTQFEDQFPFVETPDQLKAINDCKADMERPRPMDRLLCGDVGFGKTEVAIRACLKAVLDGKQAAILIPTTILCQQHFLTLRERFADLPIVVEMLSRFRTPTQRREILKQLASGRIDIVVGTHSLLARNVVFGDLGLLVIDEEHRFGVRQKEKIKQLKANVDVLAMSATPIPRTLYGALVGVRDLSVIETPPRNRLPIQTFVKSYDDDLVRRAISAELERGGQVFYLHNRVQTIHQVVARLEGMLPNARIACGHGQMEETQLERVMVAFVEGRYDVLVCTTIIESGLDIPNCNTMIIEGADRFGLSQLYQLRGRVGRFNRQAYAYLLLNRHGRLLDLARQRLGAIRQYNKLGAGFRVAMRDLELRGAGNLLGPEQSGHIAGVGFELYCQLLRQSIARLKDGRDSAVIRANVRLDFVVQGEMSEHSEISSRGSSFNEAFSALKEEGGEVKRIEANLPAAYIAEPRLRIDFYRRLAQCGTPDDVEAVERELLDRFGLLPASAEALVRLAEIRTLAEHAGIQLVQSRGQQLQCQLAGAPRDSFVQVGNRFPRLTRKNPLGKLKEIKLFLIRCSSNSNNS